MAIKHDAAHPRSALWGADHTVPGAVEGDFLQLVGGEWTRSPRQVAVVRYW